MEDMEGFEDHCGLHIAYNHNVAGLAQVAEAGEYAFSVHIVNWLYLPSYTCRMINCHSVSRNERPDRCLGIVMPFYLDKISSATALRRTYRHCYQY